jgi:hypothetical protein
VLEEQMEHHLDKMEFQVVLQYFQVLHQQVVEQEDREIQGLLFQIQLVLEHQVVQEEEWLHLILTKLEQEILRQLVLHKEVMEEQQQLLSQQEDHSEVEVVLELLVVMDLFQDQQEQVDLEVQIVFQIVQLHIQEEEEVELKEMEELDLLDQVEEVQVEILVHHHHHLQHLELLTQEEVGVE